MAPAQWVSSLRKCVTWPLCAEKFSQYRKVTANAPTQCNGSDICDLRDYTTSVYHSEKVKGDTETAETGKSSHQGHLSSRRRELGGMTLSCPVRCHWRRRGGSTRRASWIIRRAAASMSGAARPRWWPVRRLDLLPPHFSCSRYGWPPHPNVCPFAPQLTQLVPRARTPPLIPKTGKGRASRLACRKNRIRTAH